MVRFNLPVLLAEIASVLLVPTWTLPKLRFEVLEVEELRASCPAAPIEHKRTLSRITLDQEHLRNKPRRLFIVPPLMLRAHGTAGDMGRLHCGPERKSVLAVKATQGTVCSFSRSHPNSDRYRKDMWHLPIGTGISCAEGQVHCGARVGVGKCSFKQENIGIEGIRLGGIRFEGTRMSRRPMLWDSNHYSRFSTE